MKGLFISTVSLLLAAPVLAEITITPINLTVVGTRCLIVNIGCTSITRSLLLNTDQELTNLRVQSLDLSRKDGVNVLPTNAIAPTLPTDSVQSYQFVSVPVKFDLSEASSGEYDGVLLIAYEGGQLTYPITVRVKDHWCWPLLVLVLGIGLGVGVSAYRTDGRTRDEILVQVGRLRNQMRYEAELAPSFQARIAAYLIDVETALENKRWEAAQQAVAQSQAVWDKWRKGRDDWHAQLKYQAWLVQYLDEEVPNPDVPYVQAVRSQLADTVREIADKESPQQFRESLQSLQQQINRYLKGQTRLQQFKQLIAQLPPEKQQPLTLNFQTFEQGLDTLLPTDEDTFKRWQQEIDSFIAQSIPLIEQQAFTKPADIRRSLATAKRLDDNVISSRLAPVPPVAHPVPVDEPIRAARKRLRWFNWLSYASTMGLLAGAGFTQLYAGQPTFGANGWSDYFALFAWGFGAEATRDAVTKVVRDWQNPGTD